MDEPDRASHTGVTAVPAGFAIRQGYAAFISYSHALDGRLAPALQLGLQRFAQPWHRMRTLRVFRDETDLSARPDLWSEIKRALATSRWLVLMASPDAAKSRWVRDELTYWLENKGSERILLVHTAGTIRWDAEAGDFDEGSDAIPSKLRRVFAEEPLHVDLTWAREPSFDLSLTNPRFRSAIHRLAASIHERPMNELAGEEVRQRRRGRVVAAVSLASFAVLGASAAGSYAAFAERRFRLEIAAAQSEARYLLDTGEQVQGLVIAMETVDRELERDGEVSATTTGLLFDALMKAREVDRWTTEEQVTEAAFVGDGRVVTAYRGGAVDAWVRGDEGWQSQPLVGAPEGRDANALVRIIPDADLVVVGVTGDPTKVVDLADGALVGTFASEIDVRAIDATDDGSRLFALAPDGTIDVRDARGNVLETWSVGASEDGWVRLWVSADGGVLIARAADGRSVVVRAGRPNEPDIEPIDVPGILSRDGSAMVTITADNRIEHKNLDTDDTWQSPVIPGEVEDLSADRTGRRVAVSTTTPDAIHVWDAEGDGMLGTVRGSHSVAALALNDAGQRLITSGWIDNTMRIFDLHPAVQTRVPILKQDVSALDVCPGGDRIVVGGDDGELGTLTLASPLEPVRWQGPEGYVEEVLCLGERRAVALVVGERPRLWELDGSTSSEFSAPPGDDIAIGAIAYARTEQEVFGLGPEDVWIWKPDSPARVPEPLGLPTTVGCTVDEFPMTLAATENGARLAVGHGPLSPTTLVHRDRDGIRCNVLSESLGGAAFELRFLGSSDRLAGGAFANVWIVDNEGALTEQLIAASPNVVSSIGVSSRDDLLVTGPDVEAAPVYLWTPDGARVATIPSFFAHGGQQLVRFADGDRKLVSTLAGGAVAVTTLDPHELIRIACARLALHPALVGAQATQRSGRVRSFCERDL